MIMMIRQIRFCLLFFDVSIFELSYFMFIQNDEAKSPLIHMNLRK